MATKHKEEDPLYLDISRDVLRLMILDMREAGVCPPRVLEDCHAQWASNHRDTGRWNLSVEEAGELSKSIQALFSVEYKDRVYYKIPYAFSEQLSEREWEKNRAKYKRASTYQPFTVLREDPTPEPWSHDLYNADPDCEHMVVMPPGGGVRCVKCTGWFCY